MVIFLVTLTQLEYFRALAETEHVTKTAEALHISQTALTGMIRRLEEELDTPLFRREGRNIRLNAYGRTYLNYANAVFNELANGKTALDLMKGKHSKQISFGLVGADDFKEVIAAFQHSHPHIVLNHFEYTQSQFIPLLLSSKLDFVIEGSLPFGDDRLESAVLFEDRLCLAVHPHHHLAQRSGIYLSELEGEPMIAYNREHSFRQLCDHFCSLAGFTANTVIECYNSLFSHIFQNSDAITLISHSSAHNHSLPDAVYIPVLDEFAKYPIRIYWLKGRTFNSAMTDFLKHFINWYQQSP